MKKVLVLILCVLFLLPNTLTSINSIYYVTEDELIARYFNKYDDLSADEWYAIGVAICFYRGYLIVPTSKTTFSPYKPLTREEALRLLMESYYLIYTVKRTEDKYPEEIDAENAYDVADKLGCDLSDKGKPVFSDVDESEWYYEWVYLAYKLGLTAGIGNGEFGAGKPIKRQDFAVMVQRCLYLDSCKGYGEYTEFYSDETKVKTFADYEELSPYALNAMTFLCGTNKYSIRSGSTGNAIRTRDYGPLFQGYNGYLKPRDYITRAEAACIYYDIVYPLMAWQEDTALGS